MVIQNPMSYFLTFALLVLEENSSPHTILAAVQKLRARSDSPCVHSKLLNMVSPPAHKGFCICTVNILDSIMAEKGLQRKILPVGISVRDARILRVQELIGAVPIITYCIC